MDSVINNIIDTINHSDWSINKKIRYAYLELGKNIHKNVEFFYTLFNKMNNGKYTATEIKKIYTNDIATDNVICRDVAIMLKKIFDSCGIESEIRRFCKTQNYIVDDEAIPIQHYIVVAKGDLDKKYFLTLVPDIPNIQLGFKTEHFANNIEYLDENNEQIYEGEKVEHTIMPFEELQEIDRELGYLSLKFSNDEPSNYMDEAIDKLNEITNFKNISPLIRTESNEFYINLVKYLNNLSGNPATDCLSSDFSKITNDGWNIIKNYVFESVINIIQNKYQMKFVSESFQHMKELVSINDYNQLIAEIKFQTKDIKDNSVGLFNINAIIYNLVNMLKVIESFNHVNDYKGNEFLSLKRTFNELIDKLGILFVDKNYVYVENKEYSNGYIINKLKYYMPLIFDFGNQTKFSNMGIGEKVVILDRFLKTILAELKSDNLIPRTKKEFLDNRTYRTVVKNIETGSYLYMILIHAAGDYGNKVLLYDFDSNTIKGFDENLSFVEIIREPKYEILSDQIYIEVEKMEEYRRKNSSK